MVAAPDPLALDVKVHISLVLPNSACLLLGCWMLYSGPENLDCHGSDLGYGYFSHSLVHLLTDRAIDLR